MSEALKPPPDDSFEFDLKGIKIEPLRDLSGKLIPIEGFMLSSRGALTMEAFIAGFKREMNHNHLTTYFLREFHKAAEDTQNVPRTHPIAIMTEKDITQGLRDPVRHALFADNPLIQRIQSHRNRSLHEGALDTPRLYSHINVLMMNVIRFRALHGSYFPRNFDWLDIADAFEHMKGHEYQLNHPQRANPRTRFTPGQQ